MAKIPENNNGQPADRQPVEPDLVNGSSPADSVKLSGSGYEKKWNKNTSTVPGEGGYSKNGGNGSW